jgi:mono/diheme cytochrome c family protein
MTSRPRFLQTTALAAIAIASALTAARAQNNAAAPAQSDRGVAVFTYWCATCHAAGPGMPGTQALQVKYNGALPALLTQRTDLTPELIAFYVRNGVSVMPFFRKTEISDADLDALADYVVRSAR